MKRLPRAVRWIAILPLLVPAAIAQNPAADAHSSLAVISGKLQARGLQQPVEVLRDRWGVAHIYARNQHDLFFAQGFVAAQDRLFQMELWKRAGQGRLAEILGPSFLARDVNARLLRYRGDMKAEYESYSPDTESILAAFTDGINAHIATLTAPGGSGLPIEFRLAGFSPDTWRPEDCLNRMAAFSMTGNARSELAHAQAVALMGPEKASLLFDFDPAVTLDPAPGADFSGLSSSLLQNVVGSDQRIEFPARAPEGSNNWTVSGALTYSGKPILANDPHRVIGLPSLRYMVHLVAPGWNVAGAGEPGLPGVALGHNEHIAWGFTIFGLDQQDLYLEELNPSDPLQYKTETGWQRMETHREKFRVKKPTGADMRNDVVRDSDDPDSVTVTLKFTRHGPVLWDDGKRALALRWVGTEPGTAGYLGSLAIDRAQNWEQFEAAVSRWKVPSENLVYADKSGNIGEHSAGLAPVRKWTGLLPMPGASGPEWTGFVPVGELPHSFNPKDGYIATANHKMISAVYPYNVGFEWTAPYRIDRIRSVFADARKSHHKLTLPDMGFLQNDIVSLPALEFQKLLKTTPLKVDPSLRAFFDWDGELERKSPEAALYEVWFQHIRKALADRFAQHGRSPLQVLSDRFEELPPNAILRILRSAGRPRASSAAVPPARKPTKSAAPAALDLFGKQPLRSRNQLLTDTLKSARAELSKILGPDPAQWQWGSLHRVRFRHALDHQPGSKELFDIGPLPRPGDEYTVNATGMADSWEQTSGASYRQILDLSDWDRSWVINTPGQSGQPGSPHYSDLLSIWDAGRYFPLLYSRKAVEGETTNRLTLEP